MEYSPQQLDAALQKAETWMSLQGIEGVAQGEQDGRPCIMVWHSLPAEHFANEIPKQVSGIPVVMQYSSIIQAQDDEASIF